MDTDQSANSQFDLNVRMGEWIILKIFYHNFYLYQMKGISRFGISLPPTVARGVSTLLILFDSFVGLT